MNTNRPKIKVPLKPLDIVLDITSASIILMAITYTVINYSNLQDTIPLHFNFQGEADNYGDKSTILWLPILNVGLFFLLYALTKFPHVHNYMVNITQENALKNYRFSIRILRFTNLFLAILFAFIQFKIIQLAKMEKHDWSMGNWFAPAIIVISILLPIALFIYNHKLNKK